MILLKNCFHQCIFNITSNCYLQKVQNFEYIDFSWCISTKFCKKGQFLDLQCYYAGWMNTNSRVKLIVHFIPNLSRFLIIIICSTSADFHHILRLDFLCGIIFHQCLEGLEGVCNKIRLIHK